MSSKLAKIIKASLGGGAIVGFGYILMKTTTPTDEQLIASLSPELRQKYEAQKQARKEQTRQIYDKIQKEGRSEKPVWLKEPKDLFMSEAENQRDLKVRMRQDSIDKEVNAEKEQLRRLAAAQEKK